MLRRKRGREAQSAQKTWRSFAVNSDDDDISTDALSASTPAANEHSDDGESDDEMTADAGFSEAPCFSSDTSQRSRGGGGRGSEEAMMPTGPKELH